MARSHARLLLTIWADPQWRALPHLEQWLYALLISQQSINHAGVLDLTIRKWANLAADVDANMIAVALKNLAARRFLVIDEDTEEVLVRSFIRNDGVVKQPHTLKNALRVATQVVSPAIRAALRAELARVDVSEMRVRADHEPIQPIYQETMRLLDVGPQPPPSGVRDEVGGPPPKPTAKPFGKPTTKPIENTPTEPFAKGFAKPSGKGPGEGEGESSTGEETSADAQVACSAARTRTHARARHSPAELNATATNPHSWDLINRWRTGHTPPYRLNVYRDLGAKVRDLLAADAVPDLILVALQAWDERDNAAPGLLPHLYDDAVRATRERPPKLRVATTTARVAAIEALRHPPGAAS